MSHSAEKRLHEVTNTMWQYILVKQKSDYKSDNGQIRKLKSMKSSTCSKHIAMSLRFVITGNTRYTAQVDVSC